MTDMYDVDHLVHVDVFEGIHKYGKDICPLRTLVDALEKIPTELLELNLLDEFPNTKVPLPIESFSPKLIIEYMIKVYRNNERKMRVKPSDIDRLIYKYNSDNEEKEYIFSNNMTIYNDVIIICYLYCIMTTESEYKESRSVIDLREMMRKKYTICDDLDISQSSAKHNDLNRITWFRIAHSFPSITFTIFHHDIVDVSVSLCTTFSNVNLPKIFNVPLLAPILPRLDLTIPLALFVAFAVFIDSKEEHRCGEKTPLRKIWQDTFQLYTCKVFPTSMKLYLCRKWGIVTLVDMKYKFASYFEAAHDKGKSLISELRPNDPDLLDVLSYL